MGLPRCCCAQRVCTFHQKATSCKTMKVRHMLTMGWGAGGCRGCRGCAGAGGARAGVGGGGEEVQVFTYN